MKLKKKRSSHGFVKPCSEKARNQRSHAIRRAKERYDLVINKHDIRNIISLIHTTHSIPLMKSSNRVSIHLVSYQEKDLVTVYDNSTKEIVTFLPQDVKYVTKMNMPVTETELSEYFLKQIKSGNARYVKRCIPRRLKVWALRYKGKSYCVLYDKKADDVLKYECSGSFDFTDYIKSIIPPEQLAEKPPNILLFSNQSAAASDLAKHIISGRRVKPKKNYIVYVDGPHERHLESWEELMNAFPQMLGRYIFFKNGIPSLIEQNIDIHKFNFKINGIPDYEFNKD